METAIELFCKQPEPRHNHSHPHSHSPFLLPLLSSQPPKSHLLLRPLPYPLLINPQTPLPRRLMIHNHPRIPALLQTLNRLLPSASIRIMNLLVTLNTAQLRNPFTYILAPGVEFLGLQQGVEDAEVGLWVDARGGGPAPATVVGGEVAVEEGEGEVGFAEAPVDLYI
jgi:hypothetical protein